MPTWGRSTRRSSRRASRALADAFRNTPSAVHASLTGLSALSKTIASRDNELAQLVQNTRKITDVLANDNPQIDALLRDGNILLQELQRRSAAITTLFNGTKALSEQLTGLVNDNNATLGPALTQLDRVTTILQNNQANLDNALRLIGPYYKLLNDAVGSGPLARRLHLRPVQQPRPAAARRHGAAQLRAAGAERERWVSAMSHLALARNRRSITIAVIIAVVVLVVGGGTWWYVGSRAGRTTFSALFSETVGVYPGSDVRILGVPVGAVDSVDPQGTDVRISMYLNDGVSVRPDTSAVIISPSLVSDRYIQLTGVYSSGPKLQDGASIPLARTATSVEIDQLSSGIVRLTQALGPNGANKNGALADLLNAGAANLRGNGTAVNLTLQRLSQLSGTLSGNRDNLFETVDNLSKFTSTLAKDDHSVRGLNTALSSVSQVLADDRQSFTDALRELSSALATVKTFIDDNRALISSNVKKLSTITQALSDERASLAEALQSAPLAVDNLLNAYDAKHKTLDGRGNLNELSLWHTGTSGPPMLLPSTGDTQVSGGR